MNQKNVQIPTDMEQAFQAYYDQCTNIIDDFIETIGKQPTPDILYHYTDCTGLLGIIKSGTVFLSNIFSLNDPSEIYHGVGLASEILNEKAQGKHPAIIEFANLFNKFCDNGISSVAHFFVSCFSRSDDDLGQWRAYGDNGKGFAIGFDGNLLENAFVKSGKDRIPGNGTFPVQYNDEKLCEIYNKIIKELFPIIEIPIDRDLNNEIISKFMKDIHIGFSILILHAATLFKHEGYKNEQEYRFLKILGIDESIDNFEYKAQHNSLYRFTNFPWNKNNQNILREIVIGPSADEYLAKPFVQDCLRIARIDHEIINIHKSKIPFRA